jgi:hypothetical protein
MSAPSLFPLDHPKPSTTVGSNKKAAPSNPIAAAPPTRPFAPRPRSRRRWRIGAAAFPAVRDRHTILLRLIAHRDWQRVLIRATMFPSEISTFQQVDWNGEPWTILPLHLACALQPPKEVVEQLLNLGTTDTASVVMARHADDAKNSPTAKSTKGRHRLLLLLLNHNNNKDADPSSTPAPAPPHEKKCSTRPIKNVNVVQTGALTDDLEELGLDQPGDTFSMSSATDDDDGLLVHQREHTRHYELPCRTVTQPEADEDGAGFLPLHVACLYRASTAVLSALTTAFPAAAQVPTSCGSSMLPIHICSAAAAHDCLVLPPPIDLPRTAVSIPVQDEECSWDALSSLQLLAKVYPAGLAVRAANGMTPQRFVQESMEEGSYKGLCLDVVTNIEDPDSIGALERIMDFASTTATGAFDDGFPAEISCLVHEALGDDQDMNRFRAHSPIYSLLLARDWKAAANLVSVEPDQASEWQYGIEMDPVDSAEPKLWKRLPIHQACRLGAPLALVELLHAVYPPGIAAPDPYSGALALHYACRFQASQNVVAALARHYPAGARVQDHRGRMPLHLACISDAPAGVMYALLKAHPAAVSNRDEKGMTPCEYAKGKDDGGLEPETVALLDRVSAVMARVHRKREEGHDDDDLQEDSIAS